MARYDITSLNYINIGSNRVFFNFDSQISYPLMRELYNLQSEHDENILIGTVIDDIGSTQLITEHDEPIKTEYDEYQIILEETKYAYSKPDGVHTVFGPVLSNDTNEYFQKIQEFNNKRNIINNTYIGECFQSNNKNIFTIKNNTYIPIYDIKDVSIKSAQNIFYKNTKIDADDTYMNIYAPEFTSNPVEFCQVNYGSIGDTFLLTPSTNLNTYRLTSSLLKNKSNKKYGEKYTVYHDMQLESDHNELLMYNSLPMNGCETFSEMLSTQNIDPIQIFEPTKVIFNTQKNYILKFPISDIVTDYEGGNVHADIYPCKNHLNSTYDIEINNEQLNHNRKYCGLNKSGNDIYLKYYDNVNYDLIYNGVENGLSVLNAVQDATNSLPYQKIESFKKTTFTNKKKHKSNLFSVRIKDLVDISEVTDKENDVKNKIREELYISIQDIVKNVCPVNTQLFKVYFGNQ